MFEIYNEDCLEGMKRLTDNSIDMILTDLPYGITDCAFDVRTPFEPMWEQFKRVTKKNAAILLFSQMPFGSDLIFHMQQKPVDLLEYLIKTYTNEGETVLDATMGSGSTGVACVNTNRNFIGFEIEQNFFKIAQRRIEKATADKAASLF